MATSNHKPPDYPVAPDMQTPKRSLSQRLLAVFLIICVLLAGFFLARYLIKTKPKPKKRPAKKMETLVQVTELTAEDASLLIPAMGTVTATTLEFKPRIGGTVVSLHPNFIRGGLIAKGAVLLELDDTDYRLALEQAKNNVQRAAMDLRIEEGEQAVAKREYDLIQEFSGSQVKEAPQDLVLRQPQLAKARSALANAKAELARAELDLARTRVTVPFDCLVLEKNVAVGAQVTSQTSVARLAEADVFYVQVALPRDQLARFSLPVKESGGAPVTVWEAGIKTGAQEKSWQGYVYSLLGQVEAESLMAQLLVRIDDPFKQHGDRRLLLDSAVQVQIQGETLSESFKVPRSAVRADDTVLLAQSDDTLAFRPVTVGWRDAEWIYVTGGLYDGERLIVSPVASPIEGMSLRVAGEGGKRDNKASDTQSAKGRTAAGGRDNG